MVDVLAGDWGGSSRRTGSASRWVSCLWGSRQGITSHVYAPVVRAAAAGDPDGPAYGIALAWSGSWRLLVDSPPFRERVRVAGGVDDESTVIRLDPGEVFTTPPTLGVFAPEGAAGVRRRWHDYQRGWLARDLDPAQRPIIYNSWYATAFDVRPNHQLALADRAAELGVEAFVVDDGWFAGRTDDRHGLGNWWPDPVAFPDGLDPLISGARPRPALRHLGRTGSGESDADALPRPSGLGSIARATGRSSPCATSMFSTSAIPRCWYGRKLAASTAR